MALFLFSLLFILTPKVAERRISMSAIIFLPGRPTTDPQIMQAKNSNTTYTTLDISCPQRGADGNKETVFYSCYFNSFLADRLMKAGVKKGTGLIIIGDLELHPFVHQKGKNQGKPNSGPSVVVKDRSEERRVGKECRSRL